MWVVYLEDVTRLAGGLGPPHFDRQTRIDETTKYHYKPQRKGNKLLGGENGTTSFENIKIHRPKLVDYLVKEMIHPDSPDEKSIYEHFIERKGKRQGIDPNLIKEYRKRLGTTFLSLDSRPHLYKEMVYSELMPLLKNYETEARKILGTS